MISGGSNYQRKSMSTNAPFCTENSASAMRHLGRPSSNNGGWRTSVDEATNLLDIKKKVARRDGELVGIPFRLSCLPPQRASINKRHV
ncbi:uncharacterized protein Dere_GG27241 [Drosophila erecta]|nr:uncharacterized protein Dere_GG27241 [Drosophila erecta]